MTARQVRSRCSFPSQLQTTFCAATAATTPSKHMKTEAWQAKAATHGIAASPVCLLPRLWCCLREAHTCLPSRAQSCCPRHTVKQGGQGRTVGDQRRSSWHVLVGEHQQRERHERSLLPLLTTGSAHAWVSQQRPCCIVASPPNVVAAHNIALPWQTRPESPWRCPS